MSEKKRILLAGYLNYLNAQNINCADLANNINTNLFDITLLKLTSNKKDLIKNDFKFYWVSIFSMKFFYNVALLRAIFNQHIVYIPKHQMTYVFVLKVLKFFGVKIFTTIEGNIIDKSQKNMIDNFGGEENFINYFNLFDKVYPITTFILKNNKINFNLENRELRLGVSDIFFNEKNNFNIKNIVFIGNLIKSKGIKELLKFVDFFPSLKFHIIGEGDQKNVILKENKKNVKLYGQLGREELSEVISDMHINISFSKSEGFSKTILETAASGVPSIIYNFFGSNEYIKNEKNGFLAANFNDFKIILKQIIKKDYNYKMISKNARLMANENRWSNIVNEWEKIIYDITDK